MYVKFSIFTIPQLKKFREWVDSWKFLYFKYYNFLRAKHDDSLGILRHLKYLSMAATSKTTINSFMTEAVII